MASPEELPMQSPQNASTFLRPKLDVLKEIICQPYLIFQGLINVTKNEKKHKMKVDLGTLTYDNKV